MKTFGKYIKDRIKLLISIMIFALILYVIFFLYSLPYDALVLFYELLIVFLIFAGSYDYYKFYKRYMALCHILKNCDVTDVETVKADTEAEKQFLNLSKNLLQEKQKLILAQTSAMTDLKDYYAMWAHQVKTPIAAVALVLQEADNNNGIVNINELKNEVFKIDFYVDSVMNYLRLDDISSDYTFKKCGLDKIVKSVVKKFASQFIGKHISVEIGDINSYIYTDEKWYGFIVEQLISNAIKYTNYGGVVRIYESNNINNTLIIEDNGIGIAQEDLPRIMERGFTGYNGRMGKKSSGIGLYLVKKASQKLGVKIDIESQLRIGTKISIIADQKTIQHE